MQLLELLQIIDVKILVVLPVLLTIVQIAPIKLNPWDNLFRWVGRKLNSEIHDKFEQLEERVEQVRKDTEERAIADMRWHILNFARTCRIGEEHTKEQWNHVLDQIEKYEKFIRDHDLTNGVIKQDTLYIRDLYTRLSNEGRIR